jgi:ribosomal protein L37AE/L43A
MHCPECTAVGRPQEMRETEVGHYVCPKCKHEVREQDPVFICSCRHCTASPAG